MTDMERRKIEEILKKIKEYEEILKKLLGEELQLKETEKTSRKEEFELEKRVTDLIHEIGVPAHIKGYQY